MVFLCITWITYFCFLPVFRDNALLKEGEKSEPSAPATRALCERRMDPFCTFTAQPNFFLPSSSTSIFGEKNNVETKKKSFFLLPLSPYLSDLFTPVSAFQSEEAQKDQSLPISRKKREREKIRWRKKYDLFFFFCHFSSFFKKIVSCACVEITTKDFFFFQVAEES